MTYQPTLTALRGIAAILVLLAHMSGMGMLPPIPFGALGPLGVMMFFVLSGYLMASVYLPKEPSLQNVAGFAVARFARIYPLFAFTVLAAALLYGLFGFEPFTAMTPGLALQHLALSQEHYSGNIFWTIVVELKFYAAFALFWAMTARLSSLQRAGIVALLLPVSWAMPQQWDMTLTPNAYLFMLGMLIAHMPRAATPRSDVFMLGLLAFIPAAGLLALSIRDAGQSPYDSVALPIFAALVVWSAVRADGLFAAALRRKWAQNLGDWSFGIYLLHLPILEAARPIGSHFGLHPLIMLAPSLFAVIHAARLSFIFLEAPCRVFINRLWVRHTSGLSTSVGG